MTAPGGPAPPVGSDPWVDQLLRVSLAAPPGGGLVALGVRLAARVDDCLARIQESDQRRPADAAVASLRQLHRRAAVLLVARWLATGRRLNREEMEWIGELGRAAALHGERLGASIEGFYLWRDATVAVLREEAAAIGLDAPALEPALEMVRRSCDTTLRRMAASFDGERSDEARLLEESERRLRAVFTTMPCGGFLISPGGHVVLANQAAADLLGVRYERLVGARVRDLAQRIRGAGGRPLQLPVSEVALLTGRAQLESQLQITDSQGQERWLQIHAAPLRRPDGEIESLLVVFMDVTSVHDAAEARRESEAKSRFLAAMSHELRTPLNSVLGFAQLLRMESGGPLNERQQRQVDNILAGGSGLLGLVNDILDIAKARAGELSVSVEEIHADRVVGAVAESMTHLAEQKGIRLRSAADRDLVVLADATRLQQVLANLVMNAIKFTDRGSIVLEARRSRDGARITVSDTGVGIPADQLKRVFEEFVQVDSGRSRRYDGSGLGLPLSNRLVHLMGGSLKLESKVGEGTVAEVRLPRR